MWHREVLVVAPGKCPGLVVLGFGRAAEMPPGGIGMVVKNETWRTP